MRLPHWIRRRPRGLPVPAKEPDPDFLMPPELNGRLHRAALVPLLDEVRDWGRGKPGITRETEIYWILRDDHGRIIGAAMASDDDPPALDIEVDPRHRRKGYGTQLFAAIKAAGINVEAGSDASLERGLLTPLGYAFQVGRRRELGLPTEEDRFSSTGSEGMAISDDDSVANEAGSPG